MKTMKITITMILVVLVSSPLLARGQQEASPEPENTMMMVQDPEAQMSSAAPFIDYQDLEQAMLIAAEAPTVLFFHASWCPTCRSAREEFTQRKDELKSVNLILVDYDDSDELQKKYGVTYQHTFVQIDQSGEALAIWNGGATDELLEKLQ